jgi:hypothetical protein
MTGFWQRLQRRRDIAAIRRAEAEYQESRLERQFAHESIEDRAADRVVREHLGGIDPERLLGGE